MHSLIALFSLLLASQIASLIERLTESMNSLTISGCSSDNITQIFVPGRWWFIPLKNHSMTLFCILTLFASKVDTLSHCPGTKVYAAKIARVWRGFAARKRESSKILARSGFSVLKRGFSPITSAAKIAAVWRGYASRTKSSYGCLSIIAGK